MVRCRSWSRWCGSWPIRSWSSWPQRHGHWGAILFTRARKHARGQIIPGGVEIKGKAAVPSPAQGKFIIGVIDATNTLAELDEGNNITAQPIP